MNPENARGIARELLLRGSSESSPVYFHGYSMEPFLTEGDLMIVDPVAWEEIRRGDIITYRHQDKFPTRRVVGIGKGTLDFWCENWPTRRFRAARHDVLGRAVARRRNGHWIRSDGPEWTGARRGALREYRRRQRAGLLRRAGRKAILRLLPRRWQRGRDGI